MSRKRRQLDLLAEISVLEILLKIKEQEEHYEQCAEIRDEIKRLYIKLELMKRETKTIKDNV